MNSCQQEMKKRVVLLQEKCEVKTSAIMKETNILLSLIATVTVGGE